MTNRVDRVFGPPQVVGDWQAKALQTIQEGYLALAKLIEQNAPSTNMRGLALDALEDSYLKAKAAAMEPRATVTPDVLTKTFTVVEDRDTIVKRVWLNATDWADVRKYGSNTIDMETRAEMFRQGIQGRIWNAQIRLKRTIPVGFALPVGEDEDDRDLAPDWVPEPERLVRLC
jgi:hypothetical protein